MRRCGRCQRDVHDPDEHELVKVPNTDPRPGEPRVRRYHVCKNLVVLAEQAAADLVTGERRVLKRYVPTREVEGPDGPVEIFVTQRTKANRTRLVHKATLAAQDANA